MQQLADFKIHFIWLGPNPLGQCEYIAIKSAFNVYQIRVWLWTYNLNDKDVWLDRLKDYIEMKSLDDQWISRMNKLPSPVKMSDYLRYCILYEYGGLYLDTDTLSVRSIFNILDLTDSVNAARDSHPVNNAIIFVGRPHDPVMNRILNQGIDLIDNHATSLSSYATLGPDLLTEYVDRFDDLHLVDSRYFYFRDCGLCRAYFQEQPDLVYGNQLPDAICVIHYNYYMREKVNSLTSEFLQTSECTFAKAFRLVMLDDTYLIGSVSRAKEENKSIDDPTLIFNDRSVVYSHEADALIKYAQMTSGRYIVEVGTFKGETTRILSRLTDTIIVTIDNYSEGTDPKSVYDYLKDRPNILIVIGESATISKNWIGDIRFLFIDTNHSYESVKTDFLYWSPFVVEKGIVAFHDVRSTIVQHQGVGRFVDELLSTLQWELIEYVGSIAFIRRKMPSKAIVSEDLSITTTTKELTIESNGAIVVHPNDPGALLALLNSLEYHGNTIDVYYHAEFNSVIRDQLRDITSKFNFRVNEFDNVNLQLDSFSIYQLAKYVLQEHSSVLILDQDFLVLGNIMDYLDMVVDKKLIVGVGTPVVSPLFISTAAMSLLDDILSKSASYKSSLDALHDILGSNGFNTLPLPKTFWLEPTYEPTLDGHLNLPVYGETNHKFGFTYMGDKMMMSRLFWKDPSYIGKIDETFSVNNSTNYSNIRHNFLAFEREFCRLKELHNEFSTHNAV